MCEMPLPCHAGRQQTNVQSRCKRGTDWEGIPSDPVQIQVRPVRQCAARRGERRGERAGERQDRHMLQMKRHGAYKTWWAYTGIYERKGERESEERQLLPHVRVRIAMTGKAMTWGKRHELGMKEAWWNIGSAGWRIPVWIVSAFLKTENNMKIKKQQTSHGFHWNTCLFRYHPVCHVQNSSVLFISTYHIAYHAWRFPSRRKKVCFTNSFVC